MPLQNGYRSAARHLDPTPFPPQSHPPTATLRRPTFMPEDPPFPSRRTARAARVGCGGAIRPPSFLAGHPGCLYILVAEGDFQCVAAVHDRVELGVELGDHRDVAAPAVAAHRYQPRLRGLDPIGSPGRAASRER